MTSKATDLNKHMYFNIYRDILWFSDYPQLLQFEQGLQGSNEDLCTTQSIRWSIKVEMLSAGDIQRNHFT